LAWQGQKDGGFSFLLYGVQNDPQAQIDILSGKMLGHRDTERWVVCTYTYTNTYMYKGPNLRLLSSAASGGCLLFLPLTHLPQVLRWLLGIPEWFATSGGWWQGEYMLCRPF